MTHKYLGNFQKTIELNEQALGIAEEIGDKDSEGRAHINVGSAYHSLGDLKKAIKFLQLGLSIAREAGNKESEGAACNNLGNAHLSRGDLERAFEYFKQARSIATMIGHKDLEGKAHNNLGSAYHSVGNYTKAIECSQQALSIAKKIGKKDVEANAYNNLANVYHCLGKFKDAIEYYQQFSDMAKEIGDHDSEGNACNNLGNAYHNLGDFKKAIDFHQQSLKIAQDIGKIDLEGKVHINLGNAYQCLGDSQEAIRCYKRATSIAKKTGNKETEGCATGNLGYVYYSLGNLENAMEFYQEALSIVKEIGHKDSVGVVYNNLGLAHQYLGDNKEAMGFHQKALTIAKETGKKDSEGEAFKSLGNAYHFLHDFERAIEFHQEAVSIAKRTGKKDSEKEAYENLGIAFQSLGDFSRAEEFFKRSIKLFEEIRVLLQEKDEWKISFRNQFEVYNFLCSLQIQQGKTTEALSTAEWGRAQALADLMESQYGVNSTLSFSEEQREQMSSISSHSLSPTVFLWEVSGSVNFWVLLKGQQCQFAREKFNDDLTSLTHKMYKQIGVFKPVMCEDRSMDDPADEGRQELSHCRGPDEKTDTHDTQDEGSVSKTLYDVVIAPILHLIKGNELIIVPDSSSFLIPYAALMDQHSRYLSETLRIRLAPSLTSLRLLAECPEGYHSSSGALLVGNPWVETVRIKGKKIQQLPSSEEEVQMIGKMLNIEPLTGKNATKDQVLSMLHSVSLVHIAAHGRAETGEIILSPNLASSETPKEKDFLLTMADVLSKKLQAKLVVLSCCHSGRGKIKAEGVVGIARAFLGAGARSVIASLWAIEDKATMEFMTNFYKHFMAGQSASESLNLTMKQMRKSDEFCAVKQWAPFVLIGDDVTLNCSQ